CLLLRVLPVPRRSIWTLCRRTTGPAAAPGPVHGAAAVLVPQPFLRIRRRQPTHGSASAAGRRPATWRRLEPGRRPICAARRRPICAARRRPNAVARRWTHEVSLRRSESGWRPAPSARRRPNAVARRRLIPAARRRTHGALVPRGRPEAG